MTISNMIHKLRTNANMSQEQFAGMFGISRQSVQKWESGTSVPEMEKLLSQHFSGKSDDLIQLANQRARVVKEWLITDGKIPEERLFLLASKAKKTEGNDSGNRVDFSLK